MTKFFYTAVNGSIVEFKLHSSQLNITIYDWDYEKSQLSTKKNRHIGMCTLVIFPGKRLSQPPPVISI